MPVLEVRNIEKHFGSTRVLEDISFSLEQGQALAISSTSARHAARAAAQGQLRRRDTASPGAASRMNSS